MEASTPKPAAISLSSVNIALNLLEVPKPDYSRGRRWVLLGRQHGFMPRVLELLRKSPTASALFNRKTSLVAGDGFRVNAQGLPALAAFLKGVAKSGRHRTGDQLLKRVVKDYVRLRGYAIQVVWAEDGVHLAELHHQRFETVASGPLNERDEVEYYFLCRDWKRQDLYPPKQIPAYNPARAATEPVQLFYYFEEEPGVEYYPALDYEAALPYIELEADLAVFHGTNVATGFNVQSIIAINKGPEDSQDGEGNTITAQRKREQLEQKFKEKYTGPRAQRIMFMWGDGSADAADKMAKINPITAGSAEMYTTYAQLAQQAILSACSCTSPMVAGLPSPSGGALGGNGQELYQSFKLFFNAVCLPDQDVLLEGFRELFSHVFGVDFSQEPDELETPWLDIQGSLPVEYTFSEATMELIMTDDELRGKIGLNPLPAGAKTAAEPTTGPAGPTAQAPGAPAA